MKITGISNELKVITNAREYHLGVFLQQFNLAKTTLDRVGRTLALMFSKIELPSIFKLENNTLLYYVEEYEVFAPIENLFLTDIRGEIIERLQGVWGRSPQGLFFI